jgi:hypothetical protein
LIIPIPENRMHWINPDSLVPVTCEVKRFLFNSRGEADGLILTNGAAAHFPPHLSEEVLAHVEPGDRVTLYGVRPRSAELIACVAIDTPEGVRIDDRGPPPAKTKKDRDGPRAKVKTLRLEARGTVERLLHGPKGEIRGVLLEEGEIVRFPRHVADALPDLLAAGEELAVRGIGVKTHLATVIEATELGRSTHALKRIPSKPKARFHG